jgi:hypothetical protein
MAKNRGRSVAGWCVLAFFIMPILSWIILAIIGKTEEKKEEEMQARSSMQPQQIKNNEEEIITL